MEIPYNVTARPDTGLYNAKLGIWLFLASEVMLFGGLFSAYIFMRMSADPGYWPKGLLDVPVGTVNTIILIASSVTVILAWAALKMRRWSQYVMYMSITIACGLVFLGVKLAYEWPDKFGHFGVFIKTESIEKYEEFLGNEHQASRKLEPRREISGHLHEIVIERNGHHEEIEIHSPRDIARLLHAPREMRAKFDANKDGKIDDAEATKINEAFASKPTGDLKQFDFNGDGKLEQSEINVQVKVLEYAIGVDPVNADPTSKQNERAHFWHLHPTDKIAKVHAEDVASASAFLPRHSTYFSTYFLITGLHGLHVLGGVLVFAYMLFFGKKLYLRNPEHMANRVEVAGLFWHFVDLVWIFVFPIFYLL